MSQIVKPSITNLWHFCC